MTTTAQTIETLKTGRVMSLRIIRDLKGRIERTRREIESAADVDELDELETDLRELHAELAREQASLKADTDGLRRLGAAR